MTDIIIIGAGPAGLTAALYAHRAGHSILVLEEGLPGGQAVNTPHVENWPGTLKVTGPDFAMKLVEQSAHFNVPIRYEQVTGLIDDGAYKVVKTNKENYQCRAVILASGLQRRKLRVAGEDRLAGHGVSYCAICDGNFFRGKDVAIIGSGNTAVEDAIYLSTICKSVRLISRGDTLHGEAYLIEQAMNVSNLEVMKGYSVLEIEGEQQVEKIVLTKAADKVEICVSGIFVAIGFSPENSRFSPPLQLDEWGFVITDEDCTTNIPGIFAAGDCRTKEFRQLITAAADGSIAASKAGQYLSKGSF